MKAVIDTREDREPEAVIKIDVVRSSDDETGRINANRDTAAIITTMLEVWGERFPEAPVRIIAEDVPAADHLCRPYCKNKSCSCSGSCSDNRPHGCSGTCSDNKPHSCPGSCSDNRPHSCSGTCSNDKSRFCAGKTYGPVNRPCRSKRNSGSEPYSRQEDL